MTMRIVRVLDVREVETRMRVGLPLDAKFERIAHRFCKKTSVEMRSQREYAQLAKFAFMREFRKRKKNWDEDLMREKYCGDFFWNLDCRRRKLQEDQEVAANIENQMRKVAHLPLIENKPSSIRCSIAKIVCRIGEMGY